MEKRFLLALGLSFLVLFVYSSLVPKPQPIANQYVGNKTIVVKETLPPPVIVEKVEQKATLDLPKILDDSNLYHLKSNGLDLKFSKIGGFILETYDKEHKSAIAIKNIGLVRQWSQYPFNVSEVANGVVFEYLSKDGYGIKKIFIVSSGNIINLTINIYNISHSDITTYDILGGEFDLSGSKDPIGQRYYEASLLLNGNITRKPMHGLKKEVEYQGDIAWIALRDRYFCSVLMPEFNITQSMADSYDKKASFLVSVAERNLTAQNSAIEDRYKIYVGPQDERMLKEFAVGTDKIINFGTFDAISKIILFLLNAAHNVTRNWGWSIIFVTIFIYFILFPLSFKSMLSMKKMQALQPKIEELRTRLKDNPQKLNLEIMELYKREKVNPFGGCLPMLLQIPVFFALYQLLMRLISLKGAPFLWIKDLSEPDRLIIFKENLPLIGNEFNILPLLMAAGMFFQQKLSSSSSAAGTASTAAEQQKMMMIIMPVMFGVLFYKMSSGLVLYWFVNSLLMLGFQWKISKVKA